MQNYETVISQGHQNAPNIAVVVEGGRVRIVLNQYRLYNTMAYLDTILVGLHEKVKVLIQKHLLAQAMEEDKRREER